MTIIDWAIVALAVVLIPIGYRQGLLVAAFSLAGFAGGAILGSRLAPLLLDEGSSSPYAPAIALLGGLLLGSMIAVVLETVALSLQRRVLGGRVSGSVDAVGGAVLFVALALAIAWVAGALALNAPALNGIRADVQRSLILGEINRIAPPSGPILNVLNRIGPTPTLRGPSADVAAPDEEAPADPEVAAASQSVVHVVGTACGLNLSGSGWIADSDLVVTNAHVIAGQEDTAVITREGSQLDATPVFYRPTDDIAVLRVDGLESAPLEVAPRPRSGTTGAILGYPGEGDFSAAPARLGSTGTVRSQDSYGRGPIERKMTSFRGEVIPGNSGGPVVDGDGRVMTTVFASAVGSDPEEGLGVPNGIVRRALSGSDQEVGTGPCA